MLACILCGKEFEKRVQGVNKFCSLDCSRKHRQQHPECYKRRTSYPTCPQCGKEYQPTRDKQKFCSHACHSQAQREAPKTGVSVQCAWCGKEVYRLISRLRNSKHFFCSHECQGSYQSQHMWKLVAEKAIQQGDRVNVACTNCGKSFKPRPNSLLQEYARFCSRECHKQFLCNPRAVDLGVVVKKTCENCQKEFDVPRERATIAKYCSRECSYTAHTHATGTNTTFRYIALRDFPKKCMICGFDVVVAVHHIIPQRHNGKNEIDNLIVLCPNHHAMADKGLISTQELLALNAEARAKIS